MCVYWFTTFIVRYDSIGYDVGSKSSEKSIIAVRANRFTNDPSVSSVIEFAFVFYVFFKKKFFAYFQIANLIVRRKWFSITSRYLYIEN